jgi:uncharacterized protein (TIGR03067 family)
VVEVLGASCLTHADADKRFKVARFARILYGSFAAYLQALGHTLKIGATHINHPVVIAIIAISGACGGNSVARIEAGLPTARSAGSQSILGRWALVLVMRNGEDRTNRGTGARYYTFYEDGTFRITLGDSVLETGTWTQDTTVVPKIFDHIPNVDGRPGQYVPGIFAIDGDTLKVSILPPNPERRRPTQFRSVLEDRSWLLVYRRAPP